MASDKLEYILTLNSSDFTAKIQAVNTELEKASGKNSEGGGLFKDLINFELLKRGFDIVVDFFKDAIAEAQESIRVNSIWVQSVQKAGLSVKDARKDVKDIAETNAFTENDVKKVYNYGQAIGLSGEQLTKFVKTAIDYSTASGKNLLLSMRMVGTEAKKGADEFERFSANVRGAGADAADADGGLRRLNVGLKELTETAGTKSIVALTPLIQALNELIKGANKDQTNGYEKQLKDIGDQITANNYKMIQLQETLSKQGGFDKLVLNTQQQYNNIKNQNAGLEAQRRVLEGILGTKKLIATEDEKDGTIYKSNYFDIVAYMKSLKESMAQYGGITKEQVENVGKLQKAIESVAGLSSKLVDLAGAQDKQLNEVFDISRKLVDAYQKLSDLQKSMGKDQDLSKLSAGDWLAIIELVVNAFELIGSLFNQQTDAEKESAATQTYITGQLEAQKTLLAQINDLYSQQNILLNEDKAIKYQTSAVIEKEIEDTKALLKTKQDVLASDQQTLNLNNAKHAQNIKDLEDDKKKAEDVLAIDKQRLTLPLEHGGTTAAQVAADQFQIDVLNTDIAKNQAAIVDTNSTIVGDSADIVSLQQQLVDLTQQAKVADDQLALTTEGKRQALLEAQTASLKNNSDIAANETAIENSMVKQISLLQDQLANTSDQNDQLDLQTQIQQKQNDLAAQRLAYQTKINGALQDQINLGLIDVQSYAGIGQLQSSLNQAGVYGTAQATQLNTLGVRNDRNLNIGQITVTNNEANLNTIAGSIGSAINNRL